MTYNPAYPSGTNTFIPRMDAEGTAGLVVNFSRNPAAFKLPRWASYTPVKRWQGLYLRMTIEECARMLDPTSNNNVWPLGNDAPQLTWGTEGFSWMPYTTERYAFGFVLPNEAEQQGDFSPQTQNAAVQAQKCMTARTQKAVTVGLTTGNYDASHVDTAANWGGGYLGSGTPSNPIFFKALQNMFRRIHIDTKACVTPNDMVVVMNPALANVISQSEEIHSYLKESPFALDQMRGNKDGQNANWGLPMTYAGFRIEVEDGVKTTTGKGIDPQDSEYIFPWDQLAMFARPGGLIAPEGATSFSTVHVWLKEDMTMESFDDPINRRTTNRIVDFFGVDVVAPVSGCICTATLASQPTASVLAGAGTPPATGTPVPVSVAPADPQLQARLDELFRKFDAVQQETATLRQENEALRTQLASLSPESPATTTTSPEPRKPDGGRGRRGE